MNTKLYNAIIQLHEALKEDSSGLEAYCSGEYIYGLRMDSTEVTVHVQWPRFHKRYLEVTQSGAEIHLEHTVTGPQNSELIKGEQVHVRMYISEDPVNYTAIVDKATLVDLLREHDVPETKVAYEMRLAPDEDISAASVEALWNAVERYECLC